MEDDSNASLGGEDVFFFMLARGSRVIFSWKGIIGISVLSRETLRNFKHPGFFSSP